MSASEAVVWSTLGALNLAVSYVLLRARPLRTVNVLAAVMIGANGLYGAKEAVSEALGYPHMIDPPVGIGFPFEEPINIGLNALVFAAFIALPFYFPRRRLGRIAERLLVGTVVAYVALTWGLLAMGAPIENGIHNPLSFVTIFIPFFAGAAIGTMLLLDDLLSSPSRGDRVQSRFLLAVYVLKLGSFAAAIFASTSFVRDLPATRVATMVLLLFALGCVAIRVVLAIARDRAGWRDHLFVLGFLAGSLVLDRIHLLELEYMILRPLLVGYAVLQYQLLDVDLRARRVSLLAILLAAVAGTFLVVLRALEGGTVETAYALPIAFVAAAALCIAFASPILRHLVPQPRDEAERGRELYRAAVEHSLGEEDRSSESNERVLRALRARLGISDREHAAMEAESRTLLGRANEPLALGERFLGRYRVEKLLGEGGFGRTWLARDEAMGRMVVFKTARASSAEDARRMQREARLVAALNHPNVVTVHDVEIVAGECALVMEHMEGGSLAARLANGKPDHAWTLRMVDDVLAALEAAHAAGMVHRDVKPGNILLAADGRAKLADFGVAREIDGSGTASGISLSGHQPGSLAYMSPEQVRGLTVDARSDLYSLATVAYEAFTGRHPLRLRGRTDFEVRLAILEDAPQLPAEELPAPLNAWLARGLAKDRDARPSSASAMRADLRSAVARP